MLELVNIFKQNAGKKYSLGGAFKFLICLAEALIFRTVTDSNDSQHCSVCVQSCEWTGLQSSLLLRPRQSSDLEKFI